MAGNGNDAETREAMLVNVNMRINEKLLNNKPIDSSLLALRDQLTREVAADAGQDDGSMLVYEDPRHPFPANY